METINKLADNVSSALQSGQQKPESNGNETILTPKMVISLWERMTHIYGHKWTSNYGESAISNGELTDTAKTWASALRSVTGQQLADGLRACLDRGDTWPPTLPEFKQLCDGKTSGLNEHGLDYVPEYLRERITDKSRLLKNGTFAERQEAKNRHMDNIKEMLRGKR